MSKFAVYLTLTSVVFELYFLQTIFIVFANLTLTSVVFEYLNPTNSISFLCKFNFNKCCIWMPFIFIRLIFNLYNLTLTSVVFELLEEFSTRDSKGFNFNKCCIWIKKLDSRKGWNGLFNFNKCCIWIVENSSNTVRALKFNFNKCCIWMQ